MITFLSEIANALLITKYSAPVPATAGVVQSSIRTSTSQKSSWVVQISLSLSASSLVSGRSRRRRRNGGSSSDSSSAASPPGVADFSFPGFQGCPIGHWWGWARSEESRSGVGLATVNGTQCVGAGTCRDILQGILQSQAAVLRFVDTAL